jgi:hypothetical protein
MHEPPLRSGWASGQQVKRLAAPLMADHTDRCKSQSQFREKLQNVSSSWPLMTSVCNISDTHTHTKYLVIYSHWLNKRNSSVTTVTRLRCRPANRGSNPAKRKTFFSSPEGPDYVLESLGVNSIGGWVGPRGCRTVWREEELLPRFNNSEIFQEVN